MTRVFCGVALGVAAGFAAHAEAVGLDAFREVFVPDAKPTLDAPRVARYVALFDEAVEERRAAFDFEKGLLPLSGELPPPEIAELDRYARKAYAGRPEYTWVYRLGRTSASDIGAFALAWACPQSKHFGDEQLREGVVRGIDAYLQHQLPSGEFAFSSIRTSSCYGTHEMAWRLEPLLAAYLCVRHTLDDATRERFHAGLAKAADYLFESVNTSQSNRGCVWCGVMAVAARVFDRPDYLERVEENWAWVGRRVLSESGQVVEGPGPDMGYSYISLLYAFRYRVAGGRGDLDAALVDALDWFYTMHDGQGIPFQAPSTRMTRFDPRYLAFLLGALEFYARERPYYSTIADEYLSILEGRNGLVAADHGGVPWMTAALLHNATADVATADAASVALPERLQHYTRRYEYDNTTYYTIRRAYRTVITLSGTHDYSGLQHWCLDGERAILCEYPGGASTLRAWGLDTARVNASGGGTRTVYAESALGALTVAWGSGVTTCYVFGEVATWVFNVAPGVERGVRWVFNGSVCPQPVLEGRVILNASQRSRMAVGPLPPVLEPRGSNCFLKTLLPSTEPVDWTVFHDGSARVLTTAFDRGILDSELAEGTSRYRLLLNTSDLAQEVDGVSLNPLQAQVYADIQE